MDQRLAEKLKALGHPARLEILRTLASRGRCVCGEVVDVMPLAQATVSQHLKILKEAGLVRGQIDGRNSCYCLDPQGIANPGKVFPTPRLCGEVPGRHKGAHPLQEAGLAEVF